MFEIQGIAPHGHLAGCSAYGGGADLQRRLIAAIPAASAVSAFDRSRDTHDLLYPRLPVICQPIFPPPDLLRQTHPVRTWFLQAGLV
ncbi:hypothetical protein [Burkholderia sp. WP9]|uniref:hypothetical protein n=1 Tax=Burkholderia sp. WP9 TaxID=1500263 RepID=UPI00115F8ABE|nr:hypothetical protein [Burkholderia sp. WP9]